MEKEKVLVIEDLPGAIEKIEKFYKEYYPKPVELDIATNFKDAEEKIQEIKSNNILWTYNYILMDGQLHGTFTDPLIVELLQDDNVPPIISISWLPDQAERYTLPHVQKGFFEHIATALYSVLLWDEIKLKDSNFRFEQLHLNGTIDHITFKNRDDDRWYRKALTKKLLPKNAEQASLVIENKKNEETNNEKQEKKSLFKNILSIFSKK